MTAAERIRELWASGVTKYVDIAAEVGVTPERVGQVLGRKRKQGINIAAALREIREEIERPIVVVVDPMVDPERGFRHGTATAYQYHGCRCAFCQEVPTKKIAEEREKFAQGKRQPTHGKTSTYRVYGCRCGPCTRANTINDRPAQIRYRERQRALREAS